MGYMKNLADSQRQQNRRGRVQAMSELDKYVNDWARNEVLYWQERIDKLGIHDTGALRSSIVGMVHPGPVTTIEHSFLLYGKYVNDGVAREFGHGYTDSLGRTYSSNRGGEGTWNSGQLPFLLPGGEKYREEHGLDKPKRVGPAWGGRVAGGQPHRKRDWYFRKYYASRQVLNRYAAAAYGLEYQGMLTVAAEEITGRVRIV